MSIGWSRVRKETPTRYCSECGKAISWFNRNGKKLKPFDYCRNNTCGERECITSKMRKAKSVVAKVEVALTRKYDAYDYFILGHQHLLRKAA